MSKLKVLKSIAHNVAHSYLSLMGYIDENYIVEFIFQIAKEQNEPNVRIDILKMKIEPEEFRIPTILESLEYLKDTLERLLVSDHLSFADIDNAEIVIEFDLNKTQMSRHTDLELPTYKCISEIKDINGKKHEAKVVEWWRY